MGDCLPITVKVYINNQVLIPANVVRCLGVESVDFIDVMIRFGSRLVRINNVRLLKPARGRGSSRQFTIPREIREEFGIEPLSIIELVGVKYVGCSIAAWNRKTYKLS